ncbi:unnamed protein product [Cunninghamella blakesleeana]
MNPIDKEQEILNYCAKGDCYYGAASCAKKVYRKEIPSSSYNRWPPTAKDILTLLELLPNKWNSEHIKDLNKTILPFPGYLSDTINDEIHNDVTKNYIFKSPTEDGADFQPEYKEFEKVINEGDNLKQENENQDNKKIHDDDDDDNNNNNNDNDNDNDDDDDDDDDDDVKKEDNKAKVDKFDLSAYQDSEDEAKYYPALKSIVKDGIVWFVLCHPNGYDLFEKDMVDLFAVGFSKISNHLIGIQTEQVCHNLCD